MPLAIQCPHCAFAGSAPDAAIGKKVNCPKCKQPFAVQAAPPQPVQAPIPSAAAITAQPQPVRPLPRWLWPAVAGGSCLILLPLAFLVGRASVSTAPVGLSGEVAAGGDPKIKAFKDRMAIFSDEGRALTNLLGRLPSPAEYRRQQLKLNDAFDRLLPSRDLPERFKEATVTAFQFHIQAETARLTLETFHLQGGANPKGVSDIANSMRQQLDKLDSLNARPVF